MFYNCSSLSSLPDISKWNTNNITDMIMLFAGCSSLSSLPDIQKWNNNNAKNNTFRDIVSLISNMNQEIEIK